MLGPILLITGANFAFQNSPWDYIREGLLFEGCLSLRFGGGGAIFAGGGVLSEFYGICWKRNIFEMHLVLKHATCGHLKTQLFRIHINSSCCYFQAKEEQEKKEKEMQKTTPHFWNLNEDSQLSRKVLHFIKPGNPSTECDMAKLSLYTSL